MDSSAPGTGDGARRRATGWFWALVVTATVLAGALSHELAAPPAPPTGLAVALTGPLLVAVVTQATRLLLALTRTPTTTRRGHHPQR